MEYRPEEDDPARKLLGSIFKVATTQKIDREKCLRQQEELYNLSERMEGQDVLGDTGEIRLLILPNIIKSDSDEEPKVGKFKFFDLKKILEKNLTKIQEYFLSYNNL